MTLTKMSSGMRTSVPSAVSSAYGSFRRNLTLPEGDLRGRQHGQLQNGVLEIKTPSPPGAINEPRKIPVNTG